MVRSAADERNGRDRRIVQLVFFPFGVVAVHD
jgi:hypothetical protein